MCISFQTMTCLSIAHLGKCCEKPRLIVVLSNTEYKCILMYVYEVYLREVGNDDKSQVSILDQHQSQIGTRSHMDLISD